MPAIRYRIVLLLITALMTLVQGYGVSEYAFRVTPRTVYWDGSSTAGEVVVRTSSVIASQYFAQSLIIRATNYVNRTAVLALPVQTQTSVSFTTLLSGCPAGMYWISCSFAYCVFPGQDWPEVGFDLGAPYHVGPITLDTAAMMRKYTILPDEDMLVTNYYLDDEGFIGSSGRYVTPPPLTVYALKDATSWHGKYSASGPNMDYSTTVVASREVGNVAGGVQFEVPYRGPGRYWLAYDGAWDAPLWESPTRTTAIECHIRRAQEISIPEFVSLAFLQPPYGNLELEPEVGIAQVPLYYSVTQPSWPGVSIVVVRSNGEIVRRFPIDTVTSSSGTVIWDGKNGTGECVEPGTYIPRVDYGYDWDPTLSTVDPSSVLHEDVIHVPLTVYDVYASNSAPLYVGDSTQGSTTIHYTLNAEAQRVTVCIGYQVCLPGGTAKGANEVTWDGRLPDGQFVPPGVYPITVAATPKGSSVTLSRNLGLIVDFTAKVIGSVETVSSSFTPADGEILRLKYRISDKPPTTGAFAYSKIYDASGQLVRVVADGTAQNLNDGTSSHPNGDNALDWDGKDESGDIVAPGTYTWSLFAKGNVGMGRESILCTNTVTVSAAPPTEIALDWPSEDCGSADEDDTSATEGYTDSGQPVSYSSDGGATWASVTPDASGFFSIPTDQTPGPHTMCLRTDNASLAEASRTVPYFVNNYTITSPADDARFDPQSGATLPVQFTADYADSVAVYVVSYLDQPPCISAQNPVPAAEQLNGTVSMRTVRTIFSAEAPLSVTAGTNSVIWDGKDDSGQYAPPGLYSIVVERTNTDGLLDLSAETQVLVEHSAGTSLIPSISDRVYGTRACVLWTTSVPTTGYLAYESDDGVGRIAGSADAGTRHAVWLPGSAPDTTYIYHVVATDPASGNSAVSAAGTVQTGSGARLGNTSYCVKSPTEVDVTYSSKDISEANPNTLVDVPQASAIVYSRVAPSGALQWQRVDNTTPAGEHTFSLTGLVPNSEYVYKIIAAADSSWANSTTSQYMWFATKTDPCSVNIRNIEDGESVDSLSDIVVRASAAAHRFSPCGITAVQLYVDDQPVDAYDVATGSDPVSGAGYIEYTFHAGSLGTANGIHQLDAVATDDFWNETHTRVQVMVGAGGGGQQLQTQSLNGDETASALTSPLAWLRNRGSVQVVSSQTSKLGYRAGPRLVRKRVKGSIGYLYLGVPGNDGKLVHFWWRASSGLSWNWRSKKQGGTIPPGVWHTAPHPRVRSGGVNRVEGVPDSNYGAYLIHPSARKVANFPQPPRSREAFHIHGNWAHNSSEHGLHDVGGGRKERFYYNSVGCIILYRKDVLDLKSKWQTYVLHGAQHGPSSLNIPLRVEYYNKQVEP